MRLAVPDPMPVLRVARISMAFGHLPVEYRIYRLDAEGIRRSASRCRRKARF
ncbi:MAG: hypothetical protein ACLUNV_08305 [Sutterella wadsworthensis]